MEARHGGEHDTVLDFRSRPQTPTHPPVGQANTPTTQFAIPTFAFDPNSPRTQPVVADLDAGRFLDGGRYQIVGPIGTYTRPSIRELSGTDRDPVYVAIALRAEEPVRRRRGVQIASGLADAHKLDIVHRDLELDNIMIRAKDDNACILERSGSTDGDHTQHPMKRPRRHHPGLLAHGWRKRGREEGVRSRLNPWYEATLAEIRRILLLVFLGLAALILIGSSLLSLACIVLKHGGWFADSAGEQACLYTLIASVLGTLSTAWAFRWALGQKPHSLE